jgi:hypothetical protein
VFLLFYYLFCTFKYYGLAIILYLQVVRREGVNLLNTLLPSIVSLSNLGPVEVCFSTAQHQDLCFDHPIIKLHSVTILPKLLG